VTTQVSSRTISAGAARVTAARHAAAADAGRSLAQEVVAAIVDAGFARWFVPERWGGVAGGFAELTAAVATLGEGCLSAAWCASLAAYGARQAACLPLAGQEEVWGGGPDAFLVGAVAPAGKAEPVAGGWRLTGTWSYVSAVAFAGHAMIAARLPGGDVGYFAVPRGDFRVEDTWFTVGMRGTGSNTIVVEDMFVPGRRAFGRADLAAGRPVGTTAVCHRTSLAAVTALPFAAPVLGAGRAAVAAAVDLLGRRREDPAVRVELSRAAGAVDAAELLLGRAASVLDSGDVPGTLAARGGRDIVVAVELVVDAVNRLFRVAGTSGHTLDRPLERIWRDVNTAGSHSGLRPERSAAAWATVLFGGVA
jgi:alkylation response protein AidB-like acyl-CoA dehydrogenase